MTLCSPSFFSIPSFPPFYACTLAHAHRHTHKHLPLAGLQQSCPSPESIGGNRAEGLLAVYMRSQRLASHRPSCRQGNNTDLTHKVLAVKCEKRSQWTALEPPPLPLPLSRPGRATANRPSHTIVAALTFSRHISKSASCVKVPRSEASGASEGEDGRCRNATEQKVRK